MKSSVLFTGTYWLAQACFGVADNGNVGLTRIDALLDPLAGHSQLKHLAPHTAIKQRLRMPSTTAISSNECPSHSLLVGVSREVHL
jgi:hypothetical protein